MDAASNEKYSVLSVGAVLASLIRSDARLTALCGGKGKIAPVAFPENVTLPYITYRRAKLTETPVKSGRGSATAAVELRVWSETYESGLEIAERLTGLLDNQRTAAPVRGLVISGIALTDAWENELETGEYEQGMIFEIKTSTIKS